MLRLLTLMLVVSSGCHDGGLDVSQLDAAISPCVRSGGSCVERAPSGATACAADEIDVQGTPQLCGEASQDCCVARCPQLAPALGSPCRVGSACSYTGDLSCTQYICFEGLWVVLVSDCSS